MGEKRKRWKKQRSKRNSCVNDAGTEKQNCTTSQRLKGSLEKRGEGEIRGGERPAGKKSTDPSLQRKSLWFGGSGRYRKEKKGIQERHKEGMGGKRWPSGTGKPAIGSAANFDVHWSPEPFDLRGSDQSGGEGKTGTEIRKTGARQVWVAGKRKGIASLNRPLKRRKRKVEKENHWGGRKKSRKETSDTNRFLFKRGGRQPAAGIKGAERQKRGRKRGGTERDPRKRKL